MAEEKQNYPAYPGYPPYNGYAQEDDFDFMKYWNRFKPHWKIIACCTVAAFVIGCVYALLSPRIYTVETTLAPEVSSSAANKMSSLASLVGMSASMLGSTDAIYPVVYPEVLKSPKFLVELFDVPVTFEEKGEQVDATLYEYLTEHRKFSIMALPGMAIKAVMGIFAKKEPEEIWDGTVDSFHLTKKQGKVVDFLGKHITAVSDKKTMALTITVTMSDPLIAATVASAVNDNLRKYITEYRTEKAKKDCAYYETLYDNAQKEYYEALTAYSRYADTHQGIALRSSMIESERLKNEADLKYTLYTSNAQQLQMARAKVQLETPVFAELIPPTVPLKPSNSRKKTALTFAFMGALAGCAWVWWITREKKEEENA